MREYGPAAALPGGIGISRLTAYDIDAPDGLAGGTPHVHLACSEGYYVIAGSGAVQTLDPKGFTETPLQAGAVVWFDPGTIHRLVNGGGLQLLVPIRRPRWRAAISLWRVSPYCVTRTPPTVLPRWTPSTSPRSASSSHSRRRAGARRTPPVRRQAGARRTGVPAGDSPTTASTPPHTPRSRCAEER